MIDEYNQGAADLEEFFERLLKFVKELQERTREGFPRGYLKKNWLSLISSPSPR